jgi:hypothetical protein
VANASGAEWRPLWSIAKRESAADYLAEHKLKADREGSLRALKRNRDRLFAGNPFLDQIDLWDRGRGPFGMMPANHLHRWDAKASPMVLHDPWIASVIALRLVERHKRSGAQTWAQVNEGWASGKVSNTSAGAQDRAQRFRARLERDGWGHLADAEPRTGTWGVGPQPDQASRLAAIAARCTGEQVTEPVDPTVPPLTPSAGGTGTAVLAAVGAIGLVAGAIWWARIGTI